MAFALAGTDVSAVQRILDTPVREVCMAYLAWLRDRVKEDYDRALMVWSNQSAFSKAKPPEMPHILH